MDILIMNKLKTIIVKSANWEMEVEIDNELFNDIHLEACTRALEIQIKNNNKVVSPFMTSTLKGDNRKLYTFNTYKILINASYFNYAENLRNNFKKQTNIDLETEPIMGR